MRKLFLIILIVGLCTSILCASVSSEETEKESDAIPVVETLNKEIYKEVRQLNDDVNEAVRNLIMIMPFIEEIKKEMKMRRMAEEEKAGTDTPAKSLN